MMLVKHHIDITFDNRRYPKNAKVTFIVPTREPDYIDTNTFNDEIMHYWFVEHVASSQSGPVGDYEKSYFITGICPVTGLLMEFSNSECSWYISHHAAQEAYALYLAERSMLSDNLQDR